MNRSVPLLVLALGSAYAMPPRTATADQPEPPTARAQVLVLGVYHMANPGYDLVNMNADDVLAP